MVYRYTNRPPRADDEPPRESLLVERRQRVDGYCFQESGIVRHFGDRAVRLTVIYEVAADFADMFEVRGFRVEAPERAIRTRASGNVCSFAYGSSDRRTWETQVELTAGSTHAGGASPVRWTASDGVGRGKLRIHLEPGGRVEWALAWEEGGEIAMALDGEKLAAHDAPDIFYVDSVLRADARGFGRHHAA